MAEDHVIMGLRLPLELKHWIAKRAALEERSVNKMIILMLKSARVTIQSGQEQSAQAEQEPTYGNH